MAEYRRKAAERLTSEEGLRHRGRRCIEPEAVFGQMKFDMAYKRSRHFGLDKVKMDFEYLLINQGFAGKQRLMPFFNRQNNDDLILAIQSAGVERGRNGFRKNKSGEKDDESEENLLEHRTDGTDAFDTLYIGCEKFPQHEFYPINASGVM